MGKSEQTKAFIIEKTAPLFNSKGYAGTSLNDMTDATRLTKGSIYGNFVNKDEVAVAAFEYNVNKIRSIVYPKVSESISAKNKLIAYGEVYTNPDKYNFPVGGCPILNTATEADDTHPELQVKVAGAINTWKKNFIRIIQEGIENKEFSKNSDPEQVAISLIALLEGGIMISKATGKSTGPHIMKTFRNLVDQL
jgi:AcrR family transcriptional regulator